uniref:Uncharacterized protein n=1 Tax=Kalanchoe fedtschenkoi TaxID=63787 RepID=A0A7N0TRA7_KALFE
MIPGKKNQKHSIIRTQVTGLCWACDMSLPDLWKSRCCLDKAEGFDHSAANFILVLSPFLPFLIWQCGEVEELSGRETESIVISTGPDKRYWKQGVKLLATPKAIETNGATSSSNTSSTIEASFDPSHGELTLHHIFAP